MSNKYKISVHQFDPKMARVNLFHMRPNETLIASQDTRRPDLLRELVDDANCGAAAQQAPATVGGLMESMRVALQGYVDACGCGGSCGGGFKYPKCERCANAKELLRTWGVAAPAPAPTVAVLDRLREAVRAAANRYTDGENWSDTSKQTWHDKGVSALEEDVLALIDAARREAVK